MADASNPAALDQISAVYRVLEELGIEAKDALLVLNKVDAADLAQLLSILSRYPRAISVSARRRQGLDALAAAVSQALSHSFLDVDVETGVDNGRLLAALAAHGEVLSKRYTADNRVVVHCRVPQRALAHLHSQGTTIRPHAADLQDAAPGADPALGKDAAGAKDGVPDNGRPMRNSPAGADARTNGAAGHPAAKPPQTSRP